MKGFDDGDMFGEDVLGGMGDFIGGMSKFVVIR